jgi:hypothetical protein
MKSLTMRAKIYYLDVTTSHRAEGKVLHIQILIEIIITCDNRTYKNDQNIN